MVLHQNTVSSDNKLIFWEINDFKKKYVCFFSTAPNHFFQPAKQSVLVKSTVFKRMGLLE